MVNASLSNIESTQKNFSNATPMMSQYLDVKANYQDCLLFFRMGDFFEMFFDDAKEASKILDIALTSRGKHNNIDIPMCGVPHHAADFYISKLVKAGKKIAICEQMEPPEEAKKRGYKAVVKRDVIRVITPGTLLEDELIGEARNNFLASIYIAKPFKSTEVGLSVIDISTGAFFSEHITLNLAIETLEKYNPTEILVQSSFVTSEYIKTLKDHGYNISILPDSMFNTFVEAERIKNIFEIKFLEGIGNFSDIEISAMGALAEYVKNTQKRNIRFSIPKKITSSSYLEIKPDTLRNLEIWEPYNRVNDLSLFQVIDETLTAMGKRLLISRIMFPLRNIREINSRLDAVTTFIENNSLLEQLRECLKGCYDFERAVNRVRYKKSSPIDVLMIAKSLEKYIHASELIDGYIVKGELSGKMHLAKKFQDIVIEIFKAIKDDVSLKAKTSGYIKDGYSNQLDILRQLKFHSESTIENLQNHYITETGINSLKIKRNNLIGWFVEIPLSQKPKVPEEFIWKQTITNCIRYTTIELDELQQAILSADDKICALESELFNELLKKVEDISDDILLASQEIAVVDLNLSFAFIASTRNFCRPCVTEESVIDIKGGRHPVVEYALSSSSASQIKFIPNDTYLSSNKFIDIITGPNMAGKSTYLRQNAIIVLLSHIGSFVPAESAVIGVVDKIFSRIGAADDLAHGKSTFMVEMLETAAILNQSTEKSFVILDEVGRGTSTFDGLAIAFGVVEHLHNINRCRTLFATHYHELSQLESKLNGLDFLTLKVSETDDNVIFDHKIFNGVADKSYGIQVAKLAGVPNSVLKQAMHILKDLESDNIEKPLELLQNHENTSSENKDSLALEHFIKNIQVDNITPKQALDILFELKNMILRI